MPIMLVRFMLFHMLFASFPSITCLLVSYHCLCMYTHGAKTYRAKAQFPRRKQKRHGHEHVEISQVGYLVDLGVYPILLGYVLFKTPSFLLPFSFRWVVLGISYCVPFILNSRVWRPLFIFLHLYFGPCSKDIGIYFPALCAYIVHDVCIYIYIYICLLAPSCVIVTICVTYGKQCLISAAKVRWHVVGISLWKSGTLLECHRKA